MFFVLADYPRNVFCSGAKSLKIVSNTSFFIKPVMNRIPVKIPVKELNPGKWAAVGAAGHGIRTSQDL